MKQMLFGVCIVFVVLQPIHTDPAGAQSPGSLVGTFQITYYYVAEEIEGGSWPLYAPRCESVLARTSEAFHLSISLEGTGRLRDGRLLNFAERCSCAKAGHDGSRICYEILNPEKYPWGRGALVAGILQPLIPFRSIAVDRKVIPLGSVLFIRELAGRKAPDGTVLDGCVKAVDTGRLIRGHHLDLFTGRPSWAQKWAERVPAQSVSVRHGGNLCPQ